MGNWEESLLSNAYVQANLGATTRKIVYKFVLSVRVVQMINAKRGEQSYESFVKNK